LFIYPEQGIALVNELAAPIDRPIQFKITSSSVMNSFSSRAGRPDRDAGHGDQAARGDQQAGLF
jgi:heme/copper-type cytochrome/quinol oxidase subunit 2